MSAAPILTVWLQLLGLLTGEVVLAVGAAVFISRFMASPVWRRTIWQVCILSLLAVALHRQGGPVTAADPKRDAIRLATPENFSIPDLIGVLWLGLIWLTGAGLVIARSCLARVLFALFRPWRRAVRAADLQNRVET